MKLHSFESELPFSSEKLFDWHQMPGAFERLAPPFSPLKKVIAPPLCKGAKVMFHKFGLPFTSTIERCESPNIFQDQTKLGLIPLWRHKHLFESMGPNKTRLVDQIETYLPKKLFAPLFAYRTRLLKNDLSIQKALPSEPLRIAITGGSGFIGSALCTFLKTAGHTPLIISRSLKGDIKWDPQKAEIDVDALEGVDACIHLAGENIGALRWSPEKKQAIHQSRTKSLDLLLSTFKKMKRPPCKLIVASAVGYFGDRGDEHLKASAPPGNGFLAEVCDAIETLAKSSSIPTTICRFGLVLSPNGGLLKKLLLPTKMGLGITLGADQWMSWITLDDLIYQLYACLTNPLLEGTFNCCSPNPVTHHYFMKSLAKTLRRPLFLHAPKKLIQKCLGESSTLILNSVAAVPSEEQLLYFKFPHIEEALGYLLGALKLK